MVIDVAGFRWLLALCRHSRTGENVWKISVMFADKNLCFKPNIYSQYLTDFHKNLHHIEIKGEAKKTHALECASDQEVDVEVPLCCT
ncbi:CLUMA_CG017069, isoform A [Clunio marinus]|uniref:CLUMA_CG017069, isoform A n=1 Tax=Clunio marinus TaxID=568069 RepID=A0A1J1IWK3_9DIPT|nr:CLUMA_CG017069, isoform A [Clunio marinus]